MGRIPDKLREIIAANIKQCRVDKYGGRGGGKKCAEEFGVSPQQWSPWENGKRTPDEDRLAAIALFFGVTVEYMRRDNTCGADADLSIPQHDQCAEDANDQTENIGDPSDNSAARKKVLGFIDTALSIPRTKMTLTFEMENK